MHRNGAARTRGVAVGTPVTCSGLATLAAHRLTALVAASPLFRSSWRRGETRSSGDALLSREHRPRGGAWRRIARSPHAALRADRRSARLQSVPRTPDRLGVLDTRSDIDRSHPRCRRALALICIHARAEDSFHSRVVQPAGDTGRPELRLGRRPAARLRPMGYYVALPLVDRWALRAAACSPVLPLRLALIPILLVAWRADELGPRYRTFYQLADRTSLRGLSYMQQRSRHSERRRYRPSWPLWRRGSPASDVRSSRELGPSGCEQIRAGAEGTPHPVRRPVRPKTGAPHWDPIRPARILSAPPSQGFLGNRPSEAGRSL